MSKNVSNVSCYVLYIMCHVVYYKLWIDCGPRWCKNPSTYGGWYLNMSSKFRTCTRLGVHTARCTQQLYLYSSTLDFVTSVVPSWAILADRGPWSHLGPWGYIGAIVAPCWAILTSWWGYLRLILGPTHFWCDFVIGNISLRLQLLYKPSSS
jgi:hypothetical protein